MWPTSRSPTPSQCQSHRQHASPPCLRLPNPCACPMRLRHRRARLHRSMCARASTRHWPSWTRKSRSGRASATSTTGRSSRPASTRVQTRQVAELRRASLPPALSSRRLRARLVQASSAVMTAKVTVGRARVVVERARVFFCVFRCNSRVSCAQACMPVCFVVLHICLVFLYCFVVNSIAACYAQQA